MISAAPIPGLFVTSTDGRVGKTVIAAAIAQSLLRRGTRVAVLKPIDTGCVRRREGLVSADAEMLAHFAAARHPLDLICPQRYREPYIPSIAAKRARRPVDWEAIGRSIRLISADSDAMIVEAAGAVMTPIDEKHTMLDLAAMLKLPALIVAPAGEASISHALLAIRALRAADVRIAGVVINRYRAELPGIAEEAAPREIERHGKASVLAIVPDEPITQPTLLPPGIVAAIAMVDWLALMREDRR